MQTAPEVNADGADYNSKDDDRDPEPDEIVEDGSESDVASPTSLRDVQGGTPVSPRVVMPTTPVPTTPRRQLRGRNIIQ